MALFPRRLIKIKARLVQVIRLQFNQPVGLGCFRRDTRRVKKADTDQVIYWPSVTPTVALVSGRAIARSSFPWPPARQTRSALNLRESVHSHKHDTTRRTRPGLARTLLPASRLGSCRPPARICRACRTRPARSGQSLGPPGSGATDSPRATPSPARRSRCSESCAGARRCMGDDCFKRRQGRGRVTHLLRRTDAHQPGTAGPQP